MNAGPVAAGIGRNELLSPICQGGFVCAVPKESFLKPKARGGQANSQCFTG